MLSFQLWFDVLAFAHITHAAVSSNTNITDSLPPLQQFRSQGSGILVAPLRRVDMSGLDKRQDISTLFNVKNGYFVQSMSSSKGVSSQMEILKEQSQLAHPLSSYTSNSIPAPQTSGWILTAPAHGHLFHAMISHPMILTRRPRPKTLESRSISTMALVPLLGNTCLMMFNSGVRSFDLREGFDRG